MRVKDFKHMNLLGPFLFKPPQAVFDSLSVSVLRFNSQDTSSPALLPTADTGNEWVGYKFLVQLILMPQYLK